MIYIFNKVAMLRDLQSNGTITDKSVISHVALRYNKHYIEYAINEK